MIKPLTRAAHCTKSSEINSNRNYWASTHAGLMHLLTAVFKARKLLADKLSSAAEARHTGR